MHRMLHITSCHATQSRGLRLEVGEFVPLVYHHAHQTIQAFPTVPAYLRYSCGPLFSYYGSLIGAKKLLPLLCTKLLCTSYVSAPWTYGSTTAPVPGMIWYGYQRLLFTPSKRFLSLTTSPTENACTCLPPGKLESSVQPNRTGQGKQTHVLGTEDSSSSPTFDLIRKMHFHQSDPGFSSLPVLSLAY
jgi:hypothetical protein